MAPKRDTTQQQQQNQQQPAIDIERIKRHFSWSDPNAIEEEQEQDDNAEFGSLGKYKNIILRERDRLNGEVLDLEKRLQLQRYYSESLEYIVKNNEDSINKLNVRVRVMLSEKSSLDIKVRNLKNNLDDQKELTQRSELKLEVVNRDLYETSNKLSKKTYDFDHLKLAVDKMRNDNSLLSKQVLKSEDDIKELRKEQKYNEEVIRNQRLEDTSKANVIQQLTIKFKKSMQDYGSMSSKVYKMNKINHGLNEEIVRLKNQINALEKSIITSGHTYEELRQVKDNILRERDVLRSDIIKTNNIMADLRHQIMVQSNTMDALRLDINKFNVKLDEAKINVLKAERERDEISQEMESLQERIEYLQEQVQLKTNQVTDLTEKLQQKNFALINVKKQLESVHSEKMILQRNLETCTQERDNFRILQAKNTHQISQLTNEIAQNQNKINSLNMRIERLNNDKKDLQSELKNKENLLASVRQDLKEMKYKNEQYMKTITDDEKKFMRIKQNLEETRKEKNLVGLQMVRRNDEIILLKEKLDVLQLALDQGQSQYNQRVEDIRLLKTEITKLQTERECHKRALNSTADMREEIIRLNRLLNQERVKVRALMEDTKVPTAVHRWRILRGEDPEKFDLMQKVQVLQKRNLKQHVERGNIEKELYETKNMFDALKRSVEKLPASDVKRKLLDCKRVLERRTLMWKVCQSELSVCEVELKTRQSIIDELRSQVAKMTEKERVRGEHIEPQEISTENYVEAIFESSDDRSCLVPGVINIAKNDQEGTPRTL
ncbi:cilia- and flagella-associated protein 58-like [Teleopsis dalmanni]|uniref:cilia- and flagella-associated protein 58-like n=1 Tax=Teleopsis dalmanni TaxID=139649 RepID=UPI0018CE4E6F|nr:cilia- and flagella-associated protein 58-like [Teleopsis dalmanni]